MAIQMIGIDHTKAVIDIRTIFSFTKKRSAEALKLIKEEKGIRGCVLISTCNRMELYVSTGEGYEGDVYELLSGPGAPVRHLDRVTAVLHPQGGKRGGFSPFPAGSRTGIEDPR